MLISITFSHLRYIKVLAAQCLILYAVTVEYHASDTQHNIHIIPAPRQPLQV